MARILIIEDQEDLRLTIRRTLCRGGHECQEASTAHEARVAFAAADFDLVLSDIMLGSESGLDLVRAFRDEGFDGVVVVMTAYSSIENAVAAMRMGVDDYLQKPLSLEELSLQVERWLKLRQLSRRVKLYERLEASRERDHEAMGQSAAWKAVLGLAERLAGLPLVGSHAGPSARGTGGANSHSTPVPLPCVLLIGETGSGKGVLARHIHSTAAMLAREAGVSTGVLPAQPFVHVNCAALPANLVEGELFGHEKGAFTDAREARPGLFEMADGGTIFLDEIGEMPLELQTKLLLVVESGRFRRIGGTKEHSVRVRVIAASNKDLDRAAAQGTFRRDLLYRLNAFTIDIPALRERGDDAVMIAEASVERLARGYGRPSMRLTSAARSLIRAYAWPGNVRELLNAVQRAVMLSDAMEIRPEDLGLDRRCGAPASHDRRLSAPAGASGDDQSGEHRADVSSAALRAIVEHADGPESSDLRNGQLAPGGELSFDFLHGVHKATDVEKHLIMQALKHTQGNVSRAARLIGMQRSSLRYRIERYALDHFVEEVATK